MGDIQRFRTEQGVGIFVARVPDMGLDIFAGLLPVQGLQGTHDAYPLSYGCEYVASQPLLQFRLPRKHKRNRSVVVYIAIKEEPQLLNGFVRKQVTLIQTL